MAHNSHNSYDRLLAYAFWLLGRRDYTEAEMLTRLNKKALVTEEKSITNIGSELVKGVMCRLRELGYINDRIFAERFAQKSLFDRSRGRFWVQQQLRKKGVAGGVIDHALGLLREEAIFEVCLGAAKAKMAGLLRRSGGVVTGGSKHFKLQQALFRFLTGRGFAIDVVQRALKNVVEEEGSC